MAHQDCDWKKMREARTILRLQVDLRYIAALHRAYFTAEIVLSSKLLVWILNTKIVAFPIVFK